MLSGLQATLALAKSTAISIGEEWRPGRATRSVTDAFRPRVQVLYENFEERYVERALLNWLDALFESLDTISDYPPPSTYDRNKSPLGELDLQQMLKSMRQLCILRYKCVPKRISEDDFWRWVYFGLEQKYDALPEPHDGLPDPDDEVPIHKNEVIQELKGWIQEEMMRETEVAERKQKASQRVMSEPGNISLSAAVIASINSPAEKTQQLLAKGYDRFMDVFARGATDETAGDDGTILVEPNADEVIEDEMAPPAPDQVCAPPVAASSRPPAVAEDDDDLQALEKELGLLDKP